MKTRKLRLLSALLALAMLLALLPTAAFAEDGNNKCGANLTWSLDSDGTLTISGTGEMADYNNSNGSPWSVNVKKAIQTVVIKNGVTSIGNCAFYNTTELTSVTFENDSKLTNIGQAAFGSCRKLTSITIPSSVTTIGANAFAVCEKLTSITIPSSVTTIGANAFKWCSGLQSVTFAPNSGLQTIGTEAFEDCHKDLIFCYSDESGKTALKNAGVSPDLIKPANPTVNFDSNKGTTVDSQTVANGEKISQPADPTREGYVFDGWYTDEALTKKYDFSEAVKDDMTLYAKWTPGGNCGATNEDKVTWTLDSDGTLTISGTGAMYDYDTGNNDLPPWYSRRDQIQEVVIGNGVTSIGNDAFYGCTKLETVDLSNATSLEKIGQYAFALCKSLSEITIPAKVERIGEYAFYDCYDYNNHSGGLKTVTFAENSRLTTIEEHAFYKCRYLEKIEIPASVTSIGGYAFNSCANLKELAFAPNSQLKSIGEYAFGAVSTDTVSPAYTSVQIPASVTEIGQNAFYHCTELKTVEFEEGSQLKALGDGVFVDCGNLETVELPSGITEIGAGAFANCGSLKEFTIPANVETIGETAFALCKNLEKITIPKSVKKIGQAAFALCPLQTVYYDGTAEEWANIEIDETKIEIDDIDFSNGILKTTTVITSKEDEPAKPTQYPITIDNGTAYIDGEPVTEAKENDVVTIVADETALDGMVFERWEVRKGNVTLENDRAAKTSFTMPAGEVQLEAMYQAADVHDSGWDAATVVTGVAVGTGTAILAYHIGMEVYAEQVLGKDVAVPRTRSEVALLAWQLAGSPAVNVEGEPLSEAAQAQRWVVESGLMQKDAQGNFNGTKKMSKWNALRTLDAAKKMG